jgi:HlyD family secretion protein
MKILRSKLFWIFTILVIGCVGASVLLKPGTPVETATIETGPIRQIVEEQGKTRLPRTYLMTMPQSGRLETILLREGATVNQGDVVAQMTIEDLQRDVAACEATVARLDAEILRNNDASIEQTALAQTERFVDSMVSTVDSAAAQVEASIARRDFAQRQVERLEPLQRMAVTESELDRAQLEYAESVIGYRQNQFTHAGILAMQAATDMMPDMVRQYIDRKKLAAAVLEAQRREADVSLQRLRTSEARGTILSPINGVVLNRFVTDAGVQAVGTPLIELGDLSELEIEAELLSIDVVNVRIDDPVEIYGPTIGEEPVRGKVDRIYPSGFTKLSSLGVEQQRVIVVVRLNPEDRDQLLAEGNVGVNFRVRVRIITDEKENVLRVPRSALFRGEEGQWQVYAVRQGRAERQNVKLGLVNDHWAEVVSGIVEDEEIVTMPENSLVDGAKVKAN